AGLASDPHLLDPQITGPWLRPVSRLTGRLSLADEHVRGYSTPVRRREIAGVVATSCERQEGRPCGPGIGTGLEVDSSAGYGQWLSAFTRIRFDAGNHAYSPGVDLDRAYLNVEAGPIAFEIGRDVQWLAPSARSSLILSDEAVPLDHVRVSTAHPVDLIGERGSVLRLNVRYLLGRLRDPQRFPGTLVTAARMQFDIADALELGGTRLLELGGEGAPPVTFREFVLEHFSRQTGASGAGISNNRLGFDASYTFRKLRGVRAYYQLAFEDTRKQFLNTLKFDTDHLVGVDVPYLDGAVLDGLLVEYHRTGRVSQEHSIFTSGMTSAGRPLGSPVGPDGWSFFAAPRFGAVTPWLEIVHFSSDAYSQTENGPVVRVANGVTERRLRIGAQAVFAPLRDAQLRLSGFAERVDSADFVAGQRRYNAGAFASLTWFLAAR
ncbi:MAG: capsule assembly Wzi family protein, partial [Myxococcales bacterium]